MYVLYVSTLPYDGAQHQYDLANCLKTSGLYLMQMLQFVFELSQ